MFEVLAELGVQYDSSVFPSPPYWAAKAAAIDADRLEAWPDFFVADCLF